MCPTKEQSPNVQSTEAARMQLNARPAGSAGFFSAESPPEAPGGVENEYWEDGLEDVARWPFWV